MSELEKAVTLMKQGYKLREIADKLDTNISRVKDLVYRQAKARSVRKKERMYRELSEERILRIKQLLRFGYTPREIAEDQEVPARLITYIEKCKT